MNIGSRTSLALAGVVVALLLTFVAIQHSGAAGVFLENQRCCELSFARNVAVTLGQTWGRAKYTGEIGQDQWGWTQRPLRHHALIENGPVAPAIPVPRTSRPPRIRSPTLR